MNWEAILLGSIPFILGIGFIGTKVKKLMGILGKITNVLKELSELLSSAIDAFQDSKITPEEMERCMSEWKDVTISLKVAISSIKGWP